ncbi:MAG: SIR2 family protein [Spirochaetes bacterium]|nr:SIR2 family protein [Spirochaetota bacterium]
MPGRESQLPIFSLENMIAHIRARLRDDQADKSPRYTLILGSGFSFPIIPPGGLMLSDIVWWLYLRENARSPEYCEKWGTGEVPIDYRKELWAQVHEASGESFGLGDGLPADSPPDNLARAYQALMSAGCPRALCDPARRRQYLRDVVRRAGSRINPAHLYLASILRAQDTWDFGVPFCRTVFTTNFDPLLQRALQLADKLYFMSDRPYVLEAPEDDRHDAVHLVYTHGSVHRYFLVNSQSEFLETGERNASVLHPYFRRHGVIVLGYGGWPDATMAALSQCETFDGNLYWCDRHPAQDAHNHLRPEVVALLRRKAGTAFYVPIAGADEALQALHQGLGLGSAPDFLVHPVRQLTSRLSAITVTPSEPAAGEKVEPMSGLEDLLTHTLQRLEEAEGVFESPREPAAVVAKRMSEALMLALRGEFDSAIATLTTVVEDPNAPAGQKAGALLSRAEAWEKKGELDREIADYTAVVGMADAPAGQKSKALFNRGVAWGEKGEPDKAIADCTAVVEMVEAPAEHKAKALINRGVAWSRKGEQGKAIADYTAVVKMADAPAEVKAHALNNRGAAWVMKGDQGKGIADSTAVIEMADAPVGLKARAFANRAWAFYKAGDVAASVSDSRRALELDAALHFARFNLGLGLLLGGQVREAAEEYRNAAALCQTSAEVSQEGIADLDAAIAERGPIEGADGILQLLRAREAELRK